MDRTCRCSDSRFDLDRRSMKPIFGFQSHIRRAPRIRWSGMKCHGTKSSGENACRVDAIGKSVGYHMRDWWTGYACQSLNVEQVTNVNVSYGSENQLPDIPLIRTQALAK